METIILNIKNIEHGKIILINKNGDTYTSKSEDLIDFLKGCETQQSNKTELPNNCNIPIVSNSVVCKHRYKHVENRDVVVCTHCNEILGDTIDC